MNEYYKNFGSHSISIYSGVGEISVPADEWPKRKNVKVNDGEVAIRHIRNDSSARYDAVGIDTTSVVPTDTANRNYPGWQEWVMVS